MRRDVPMHPRHRRRRVLDVSRVSRLRTEPVIRRRHRHAERPRQLFREPLALAPARQPAAMKPHQRAEIRPPHRQHQVQLAPLLLILRQRRPALVSQVRHHLELPARRLRRPDLTRPPERAREHNDENQRKTKCNHRPHITSAPPVTKPVRATRGAGFQPADSQGPPCPAFPAVGHAPLARVARFTDGAPQPRPAFTPLQCPLVTQRLRPPNPP